MVPLPGEKRRLRRKRAAYCRRNRTPEQKERDRPAAFQRWARRRELNRSLYRQETTVVRNSSSQTQSIASQPNDSSASIFASNFSSTATIDAVRPIQTIQGYELQIFVNVPVTAQNVPPPPNAQHLPNISFSNIQLVSIMILLKLISLADLVELLISVPKDWSSHLRE